MKMPITHNLVETARQYLNRFRSTDKIKVQSRITNGPIEGLVEDYSNLSEKGKVSFRLDLRRANFLQMNSSGNDSQKIKSPDRNYIMTKDAFHGAIEDYLLRQGMYLARVTIKRDWPRGLAVNGWPSYQMSGCLYERIKV